MRGPAFWPRTPAYWPTFWLTVNPTGFKSSRPAYNPVKRFKNRSKVWNPAVTHIVHPESPWTKDVSGHRDPFASRRVWTFNFLCVDARTQTHTDASRRMQTQMHARGRTQTHACGRTHTHTRGWTQMHAKFFSSILCPSCYMFRPWVSLSANPCPMLVAFQDPEIQLALDRSFPKPRPQTYSAQN